MEPPSLSGRPRVASPVRFRPTNRLEIPWVRTLEGHPDVRPYIVRWSVEKHERVIADPAHAHWVVEDVGSGRAVGFVILAGVGSSSVELIRIVVSRRGEGLGRAALRLLQQIVFEDWAARRLWLDVYPFNERARHLYESEGFQEVVPDPVSRPQPNGTRRSELIVLEVFAA